MRKLAILVLLVVMSFCLVGEARAGIAVVVTYSAGISPTAVMAATQGAVLLVLSPYLWQYHKNPACRGEASIGDMSKCVQSNTQPKK